MPPTQFHPTLDAWFRQAFDQPTECQRQAWPAIRSRKHTLIAAPTGSGKTLAAFLCAIDDLLRQGLDQGYLESGVQVLYVSPLKALSNDVQKNLQAPLQGARDQLLLNALPDVDIKAMVRTGDTTPGDRAKMRREPPHILVTTPESLYILLTSESGRESLRTVRTVIVDEIHALTGNKRGAHLSLSLSRLEALTDCPLTRIGLSATQKPIDQVGNFLVGNDSEERVIVDIGHDRERDLALELTGSPLEAVMPAEAWSEIYESLSHYIEQHRTTLIFVNTRRLAERLARHLAERLGEQAVTAHHGSLSREHRLNAEQRLKRGDLRALIATASLELGIDIGDVDLVCQIGSPRAISALLQRVGRSGHAVDAIPKGRLFPTTRDELIECVALLDAVGRSELEALKVPHQPLDVLTQQIIAEAAGREWALDDLYARFTAAWPYRNLSRERFDEVVEMAANGYSTRRGRRSAHLHLDAVNKRIRARRGARITALTNGGAIPDQFDYDVIMEPEGVFVGTLNEDFAFESLPGDIFQLGNTSYQILKIERSTVRVQDAHGQPPNIPFWFGEAPGRSDELSQAVSRLRQDFQQRWENERESVEPWLTGLGLPVSGAAQVIDYLGNAHAALGLLPTQNTVVFERFFDESGDTHLVIHSPFGSRINRAWGLALRKRFCRHFNFELQAAALEDTIVLSLSATHSFPLQEVKTYLRSDMVKDILIQAMLDAPVFGTRWRWAATTALALQRNRNGKRVPPQLQRMNAEDLVAVVFPDQLACLENIAGDREIPEHPLVRQAINDCLYEAMDIEGLERLIGAVENGDINIVTRELALPSPLAQEILGARPYAFLDDAPAEERRTSAVQARGFLDPETAAQLGKLDADAIQQVRDEAWPQPRDADELHDALLTLGGMTGAESETFPTALYQDLIQQRRATRLHIGTLTVWVAAERLNQWQVLHPDARMEHEIQPVPVRGIDHSDRDTAMKELVRCRLQGAGPTTIDALARGLGCGANEIELGLCALENEGFVMRGQFTGTADEWCERRLLARINRYTVKRLRHEIEPVSAADYMRFLLQWQCVGANAQLEGEGSLLKIMQQLEGYVAPFAAWERNVLPARMLEFNAGMLDRLCLAGRIRWLRGGDRIARSALKRATPLTFVSRKHAAVWSRNPPQSPEISSTAHRVHEALQQHGALFADELSSLAEIEPGDALKGLKELVGWGFASCDGYNGLRVLMKRDPGALADSGRWSLNRRQTETGYSDEEVKYMAWVLLRRYGVVFRKVLEREAAAIPSWRELLITYRRLEARGEIRGGRFVAGFSGEQFALPEAVGSLRQIRRKGNTGEMTTISAADPLNLIGSIVPGDRVAVNAKERILLRDGVPIAVQRGKDVRFVERLDDNEQWSARNALVQHPAPLNRQAH